MIEKKDIYDIIDDRINTLESQKGRSHGNRINGAIRLRINELNVIKRMVEKI